MADSGTDDALARLRGALAHRTWVPILFGVAFVASQVTIAWILRPLGMARFLALQCWTFTADGYNATFAEWSNEGVIDAYRAHFVVDDFHPIWYTVFATALLARVFEKNSVAARWNPVLLLPLASGLLDCVENRLQQHFLDHGPVDPLPLVSAIASNLKWLLAVGYVLAIVVLGARAIRRRDPDRARGRG